LPCKYLYDVSTTFLTSFVLIEYYLYSILSINYMKNNKFDMLGILFEDKYLVMDF